MSKPRVVKDYDKLNEVVQKQIKLKYPFGFTSYLITFKNAQGKFVSALPFETDDRYYLVRMTRDEAETIIEEDDDYDNEGMLKKDVRDEYESDVDEENIDVENIISNDIETES